MEQIKPHPGRILKEEFMEPNNLSPEELSQRTGIPLSTLSAIIEEKESVTKEIASLLAKCFDTSIGFWTDIQASYDVSVMFKKQEEKFSEYWKQNKERLLKEHEGVLKALKDC